MEAYFEEGNYSIQLNPGDNELDRLSKVQLEGILQDGITFENLGKKVILQLIPNRKPIIDLAYAPNFLSTKLIRIIINREAYKTLLDNQYFNGEYKMPDIHGYIEIQDGEAVI